MSRDALLASGAVPGVTPQEIIDLAVSNIGIAWTIDGCTDFVWGISNLAGAPFFDLRDATVEGDPTRPEDTRQGFLVPHSPGAFSGTDNVAGDGWTSAYSGTSVADLRTNMQPGDVVRVYASGNAGEESGTSQTGFAAHSFIVVSVDGGNIQVIDNWNTASIIQHSFEDIVAAFAPAGEFQSAFVSRLDEDFISTNIGSDLAGNGFGDFTGVIASTTPTTPPDSLIDLSTLTISFADVVASLGVEIQIDQTSDRMTYSGFSKIGDVNGDGYSDFLLDVQETKINNQDLTSSSTYNRYLFLGGIDIFDSPGVVIADEYAFASYSTGVLDESEPNPRNIAVSWGENVNLGDFDFNGDGLTDFLILDYFSGISIFLGAADNTGNFDLFPDASADLTIEGFGTRYVINMGDINGDGFDDIAYSSSFDDRLNIIFGGNDYSNTIDFLALSETDRLQITIDSDESVYGIGFNSIRDVNGDGYDDLAVMRGVADSFDQIESFVVYGQSSYLNSSIDLSTLLSSQGFQVSGRYDSNRIVRSVGDLNGDGFDDLMIASNAPDDFSGDVSLSIYFGHQAVPLGQPAPPMEILGISSYSYIDRPIGDLNGDGFDDLILAGPREAGSIPRSSHSFDQDYYIIFGSEVMPSMIDVQNLRPGEGVKLDFDENTRASIEFAGDLDSDGFDDLFVSTYESLAVVPDGELEPGQEYGDRLAELAVARTYIISGGAEWRPSVTVNRDPIASGTDLSLLANTSTLLTELFAWSDPDGLNDIVSFAIRDRTLGSGYLTKDGVRQNDGVLFDFQSIEDIGRWAFVAGNVGEVDEIGFNANDAAGAYNNPSAVAIVTAIVGSGPSNTGPSLNISEPASQSLSIPENTTFVIDLNPSDDNDSEGNGLSYTITGRSAAFLEVDQPTGRLTFKDAPDFENPFASVATSPLGVGAGYEFTVSVTDSGGLSDSADFFVRVTNVYDEQQPLEYASSLELEYFARQSAYGLGSRGEIGATPATGALDLFLDGWEIEYVFETSGDTFRAVALHKEGYAPVLAFRGTETTAFDWAENFTPAGVGVDEFEGALSIVGITGPAAQFGPAPTLAQYLASQDGLVLTGHSQGGAQAQIAAIEAGNTGATVGQVVTFNSAGITSYDAGDIVPSKDRVTHFVNASDLVSVVGATFLESDDVRYYDHIDAATVDALSMYTAHSAQWMQAELRAFFPGETFPDTKLIATGPDWAAFTSSDYSPISFIYGQDSEYLEMMIDFISIGYVLDDLEDYRPLITSGVGGAPQTVVNLISDEAKIREFFDDVFIPALSTRGGLENARENYGPLIGKALNAVGTVAQFIQDGVDFVVDGVFDVVARVETLAASIANAVEQAAFATIDQTINGLKLIAGGIHGIGEVIQDGIAAGSDAVKDWLVDLATGPAPIVVQDGVHAGSTPAAVINTVDGPGSPLSSTAPGSLFLLTGSGTTVQQVGGSNVTWGIKDNIDGLKFVVPPSEQGFDAALRTTVASEAATSAPLAFTTTDALFLHGVNIDDEDIERETGSAILRIDFDGDGLSDATVTMEGTYRLASFVTEATTDGTYIRYLGNALPVAVADTFRISESANFTTSNVLENDTDGDNDDLHVVGIDLSGTLGFVTDNGDGTFGYDPNGAFDNLLEGETATDSFVYLISDGVDTARGKVSIKIAGESDAPETPTTPTDPGTPPAVDGPLILIGDGGRDRLIGGSFGDRIEGRGGNDKLFGGDGNDKIFGNSGKDKLVGGDGNDKMFGNGGADKLKGGDGADKLNGGGGNDKLIGGGGKDLLIGGKGADDFIFNDGHTKNGSNKRDVIKDFGRGNDELNLRLIDADKDTRGDQKFGFSGETAAANSVWYETSGKNAVVFGDQDGDGRADFKIMLLGVDSLSASDFIL